MWYKTHILHYLTRIHDNKRPYATNRGRYETGIPLSMYYRVYINVS